MWALYWATLNLGKSTKRSAVYLYNIGGWVMTSINRKHTRLPIVWHIAQVWGIPNAERQDKRSENDVKRKSEREASIGYTPTNERAKREPNLNSLQQGHRVNLSALIAVTVLQ